MCTIFTAIVVCAVQVQTFITNYRLQHNVLQRATLQSIQVQIIESINKWSHRLILKRESYDFSPFFPL